MKRSQFSTMNMFSFLEEEYKNNPNDEPSTNRHLCIKYELSVKPCL
jgi:hypothetical protein